MLVLLPALSLLVWWLFLSTGPGGGRGVRDAFLRALVLHGLWVGLSTELLGAFGRLTLFWVVAVWLVGALGGSLALAWSLRRAGGPAPWREGLGRATWARLLPLDRGAALAILVLFAVSLFVALEAPPNNPDSMGYHMPRVEHWLQNRTLAHYPAHDLRQISFPGGAEYAIAQLQLLAGSDLFANCVQWLAFVGCVCGVSLLARGVGVRGAQALSALACASLPMAVLQSMTTQNDLVVSLWLVAFCHFSLDLEGRSVRETLWPTGALALALLTKATAYLFGPPMLLLLGLRIWARRQPGSRLPPLPRAGLAVVSVGLLALGLSLPHFARNLRTFGGPFGVDTGTRNTTIGIAPLLSNALRTSVGNLPLPAVWRLVEQAHRVLGLDPNDPASTFYRCHFQAATASQFLLPDEDVVASPIHLLLLLAALVVLPVCRGPARARLAPLAAVVLAAFTLYCLLIKWQYWGNRLLLPLAVLSCPLIGHFLARSVGAGTRGLVTVLLVSSAVVYSLVPFRRPIVAMPAGWAPEQSPSILGLRRFDIYYSSYLAGRRPAYRQMVDRMAADGCRSAGIYLGEPGWEYALWVMAERRLGAGVRFRNVDVRNVSARLAPEFPDSQTCARIVVPRRAR